MQPPMYDPNAGYNPSAEYDPSGMAPQATQQMYTPQGAPQTDWSSGGSGGGKGNAMLTISAILVLVLGAGGGALYATDNLHVLPFMGEEDGPSPVGKWVDASGEDIIQFEKNGDIIIESDDDLPDGYSLEWRVDGNYLHIEGEFEEDGEKITSTSKYKYDIVDDILFMAMRSQTMEEDGDTNTETYDDGQCMWLVKESTLPTDWDDETIQEIGEDLEGNTPSWCNMEYWEDMAEDSQSNSGPLYVYSAEDETNVTSNNTDDRLVKLSLSSNEMTGMNWAFVEIKIVIGDAVYDCGFDGSDECQIYDNGDGTWDVNEDIILREGGTDIVGEDGAEMNITIKYRGSEVAGTNSVQVA